MNEDFSYQKIEELVDIGLGFTHTPSYTTSGIPFLSVKNITNGEISFNSTKFISKEEFEKAPNGAKPQKGDVLFGRVGTIGYPHVIETDISFCTFVSLGYMRIKDSNILCNYYLKYWMKSDLFYSQVLSNIQGIAIKNLNTGWLKNFIIPIPPLPIQEQIVKELDTLSDIITKKKEQLAELDKLAQATFYDMFGDPVENEIKWERKKLGDLCNIVRGGSPRPISNYLGGNIPWIKIGDASKGNNIYLHSTQEHIISDGVKKSRLIPAGSLIFANCGVSLGFARIITFDGCIHDGWLAFNKISETLNEIFLLKLINVQTDYLRASAPDGTQPNLNTTIMKNFPIILPPISLQNQFAEKIEAIEQQKALINQSITDTQLLFDYTMDKYFN